MLGLARKNSHNNVWGLMNNDYMQTIQNEKIIIEKNGNNPPTVKSGTHFQLYDMDTKLVEDDATYNNSYPRNTSIEYYSPKFVFEKADKTFSWGGGEFPSISDGELYLFCYVIEVSYNSFASRGSGSYGATKTAPSFSNEKGGW